MTRLKGQIKQISTWFVAAILVLGLFSQIPLIRPAIPEAEAQAASQSTFYFKNDTATSTAYWDVTGPNNDESSDVVEMTANGATTAAAMHPIFGALVIATTSDSQIGNGVNDTNADLMWFRTFVIPLGIGTVFNSTSTASVGVAWDESNGSANCYFRSYVYVYDSGGDSNVQPLFGPGQDATEMGTTDQGKILTTGEMGSYLGGVTPYTSDANDYLAVEIWANMTYTGSAQYNTTLRWGGNTVLADGTTNTTPASFITIGNVTGETTADPLWFRETNIDHNPTNTTSTEGAPEGGTLDSRRMQTTAGAGAETNTQAATATGEWLFNIWTSPPLAAQTIPANSNFILKICGYESSTSANAYFRYTIYTWDADDTIGDTIVAITQYGTEWTTGTTNNQYELVINNGAGAITISAGERLAVEINETIVNTYSVNQYFGGSNAPTTSPRNSALLPPLNSDGVPLQYQTQQYQQTHFHFDQDNDDETHDAWTNGDGNAIAEDTAGTYAEDTNFRLRSQILNYGGETDLLDPRPYYCLRSACVWIQITNSSTDIKMSLSDQFAQGTATTRQLTDQTSLGWDFSAGKMIEDSGAAALGNAMTAWTFTEWEWSLQGVNAGDYDLKVTDSGSDLSLYSVSNVTIQANTITVAAPTDVTLATGVHPGETTPDYTFSSPIEDVRVDDSTSNAWSLTVISTNFTSAGSSTIAASNVKLKTNNNLGATPTTRTGGAGTGLTESNYTTGQSIDTAQEIVAGSAAANGSYMFQPTFCVVIPPSATVTDYTAQFTFTVA